MAKRQLNRRQQWRIKKIQDERLKRAQKHEDALDETTLDQEQEGLVIAHYGTLIDVEARQGSNKGKIFRCHFRANIEQVVTGDIVVWQPGENNSGIIVANTERHSILSRPDASGKLRPVAANINQIFIVIAPEPLTPQGIIDRYLVAAETVAIPATILINKADLLSGKAKDSLDELADIYANIGYPVITTSTKTDSGLGSLQQALNDKTSIFVGQSGVGKSSLVNTLLPNVEARVGPLSEATGKGTHTTTTAQLFHLPNGGNIIDSPGIREFGLWHINYNELAEGFVEFRPYLGRCKFRDCKHSTEPGCALQQAFSDGKINPKRITSFKYIATTI